jgi:hypothetical protein
MIAITTSNSTRVKPVRRFMGVPGLRAGGAASITWHMIFAGQTGRGEVMAMFSSGWKYWGNVKNEGIRPRKVGAPARGLRARPNLEPLEARLLLATDIWTGGDGTVVPALWSNSANWVDTSGHATIPSAGDDLVFSGPGGHHDERR